MEKEELIQKTIDHKIRVLQLCGQAGQGHVSSAFSCAEILIALYYDIMKYDIKNPLWEMRDRLVLSKNHASVMLYPILADLGFISDETEIVFEGNGSQFGGHSKLEIPGVDFAGGSLGIGLGVACGMAYYAKMKKQSYHVFSIIGDGECEEGAIWESFMFAAHNKLNNLIVYLDRNMQNMTDFTEEVIQLNPFFDKMVAFGFDVSEIDGHDITSIISTTRMMLESESMKPKCIICNTVKGNGVSALHNKKFKHGMALVGEDMKLAVEELQNGK